MSDFRVVICGGGIAAVEGLLKVRRLLGNQVPVKLIAPNESLFYRPLAVKQPFATGPPKTYDLSRIADDTDADVILEKVEMVDRDAQVVHTTGGHSERYDALLVATGARKLPAFEHVRTFDDADADGTYQGVVQDLEEGYTKSMAFLMPEGPVWPLPLYELALLTAERAYSMGIDGVELSLVTPEPAPLAVFGAVASKAVSDRLDRAGIQVYAGASAHVPRKFEVVVQPHGETLRAGRLIAMPRLAPPELRGLPRAGDGFIPIDAACRIPGEDARVYVAGDAASFPIKHGGLGAQMADTAAAGIAALAGADVEVGPFQPTIRGALLTGEKSPLYISARIVGPRGFESEVFDSPPWPADQKVVAEELGPYLEGLDALANATHNTPG
jgi:sulfide:quinone oxidoreductase